MIDGGNEWYENSIRRAKALEPRGIHYVAMGVSGGESGARNGPSLMPGGPKAAYDSLEPVLRKIAAQVDDGPCVTYIGGPGSGNYVKMVHNGIEYGDMQLIAEAYDMLRAAGLSNDEMSAVFKDWNRAELSSYLIEITSKILAKKDEDVEGADPSDAHLVDKILDVSAQKGEWGSTPHSPTAHGPRPGTGKMTVKEAAERGEACPTISAALNARFVRYVLVQGCVRVWAASAAA